MFKKNETNVKFSRSNAPTAKTPVKFAKMGPKRRYLHNYANYAGKEKKRDLRGKSGKTRLCARLCDRVFIWSLGIIAQTLPCEFETVLLSAVIVPFVTTYN